MKKEDEIEKPEKNPSEFIENLMYSNFEMDKRVAGRVKKELDIKLLDEQIQNLAITFFTQALQNIRASKKEKSYF